MSVPTYDTFIGPLLWYLADPSRASGGAMIRETHEALADGAGLSEDDRAEMLPSGAQAVYKNRIGWAHDRLKRAGLSGSPRRGVWQITAAGLALANKYERLPASEVERIASADRTSRVKSRSAEAADDESPTMSVTVATAPPSTPTVLAPPPRESPEERIEAALAELRDSVARDLLELIGRAPPSFFEHLVLDLLHAMGYGTNRSDLQRVGGSGDGGIDGIISLDRLGLEKVYVQAKRWQAPIGSPQIQTFMGALQLQSAAKGVFITTSTYTRDAREAAGRARGSIVLVDGRMLSSLMMDHGVAVSHKALRVPKVDNDYFDEG